jgi:hypothetical protein
MHHFFSNIINAIIDEGKRILGYYFTVNETLALKKNKWNYLLTKG